ncbi:unnamed protein product [marine sediment metagenome]|uniref:Uncharacterized protein n=1 Tax=marine sediment metagenome TaxID=412755 RepID=X1F6D1_9ZZZZ
MFPILVILIVAMSFFKDVKSESVENAVDVKPTFALPKVEDSPMDYKILGIPFEIETPKSKYNKTAWKLPVSFMGIEGEIFANDSLKFQIAVEMKKLGIAFSEKNLSKLVGMDIKIWMTKGTDDNNYFNCQISESESE